MSVETTHLDLINSRSRIDLVRDCVAGSIQVKKAGDAYLPRPNPTDTRAENKSRFEQYLKRAVFYNATGWTLHGLVGQVFRKAPRYEVPSTLDLLIDNIDGSGVSLAQQARLTLGDALQFGRSALFVDYPNVEIATRQQINEGTIRPVIVRYSPDSVINWRTSTYGAKTKLSLVVLRESRSKEEDFEVKVSTVYRVLRLVDGVYTVEIWEKQEGADYEVTETFQPTGANQQPLQDIPFTFVGSQNNDSSFDPSPIYDLAELNIAHYRNSADYEESCYLVGQPTPWASGLTKEWVKDVMAGRMEIGSRAVIPLPEGASAGLLQAAPNSLPKEAMEAKEKQMVALGARLIQERAVARTATESTLEEQTNTTTLASVAENVSLAYTLALEWCANYLGAPADSIEFELNTELHATQLNAQQLTALVAAWQSGSIDYEEMRSSFKKGGIAYKDDEEARENSQNEIGYGEPNE